MLAGQRKEVATQRGQQAILLRIDRMVRTSVRALDAQIEITLQRRDERLIGMRPNEAVEIRMLRQLESFPRRISLPY